MDQYINQNEYENSDNPGEAEIKMLTPLAEYDIGLEKIVRGSFGGWENAHTHLDRANTFSTKYWDHVNIDPHQAASFSLKVKQNFVGYLHTGLAYRPENLYERMKDELKRMISLRVKKVISFIDATPDVGLKAVEQAAKLREEFKEKIEFQIAAYPIFGLKEDIKEKPNRWEIFRKAAEMADLLGGLPSRDARKGAIGFNAHIKKILELGIELKKPIHFQVDQNNDPEENETEDLIQAVRWIGSPKIEGVSEPTVWAVHVISPSCYPEERFRKLIEDLLEYNIGVICCPSAAISMQQLRLKSAPIHNSIARILEMMEAGVPVKIGTDNICDIFVPNGDGKVESEVWVAANLLRFYHAVIWAKVGAGISLNEVDKEFIRKTIF